MLKKDLNLDRLLYKGHLYTGLFLLVGIWVFSISGLILNHPMWISGYWENREISVEQLRFGALSGQDDNSKALELVRVLGLRGELEQVRSFPDGDSLALTVARPGTILRVTAWPGQGRAMVESNRTGATGLLNMLHTFTGVRIGGKENRRDWFLTRLWSLSMDIISLGLLLIVASGLLFAFRRREALGAKVVALGLGILACCFYLFGLGWIY